GAVVGRARAGMCSKCVAATRPTGDDGLRRHGAQVAPFRGVRVPGWAIARLAGACAWCSTRSSGMFPPVLTPYKAAALWKRLRFSNELAKTRLGWQPIVTFEEGVRRTVEARQATGCIAHWHAHSVFLHRVPSAVRAVAEP